MPNDPEPTIIEAGAGEAPPTSETPESTIASVDTTPDPEKPAGPSQADFDTLTTQVAEYKQMAEALAAQNIRTHDDLTKRFQTPSTDDLKGIFQDVLGQKTQPTPAPVAATEPPTMDAIKTMVADMFGQQAQQQATQQFTDAASVEASLKARVLSDPRFDPIMQKATFDQAWGGEKGGAAKALAILGDHLLYERGLKNAPDGVYRPVTDTAAVGEVADSLNEILSELKAATLHELSSEPGTIQDPDAPAADDLSGVLIDLKDTYGDLGGSDERSDKEDAAIRATFEKSYRAAMAAGGNLPASQAV